MTIAFTYDDTRGRLLEQERQSIVECLSRTYEDCQELLPGPKEIEFHIVVRTGENTKSLPVEGGAWGGSISIILDTKWPVYKFPEQHKFITATVAHEWHHIVRDSGAGYGKTLAQHLVSEGLAQAFEVQVTGNIPHTAIAVSKRRLHNSEDQMKKILRKRDFEHFPDIFVGERGGKYPKWFGYSFAYCLVNEWLEREGKTASAAANVNAHQIIGPWRNGKHSPFKIRRRLGILHA